MRNRRRREGGVSPAGELLKRTMKCKFDFCSILGFKFHPEHSLCPYQEPFAENRSYGEEEHPPITTRNITHGAVSQSVSGRRRATTRSRRISSFSLSKIISL